MHQIDTGVFLDAASSDQGRGIGDCWGPYIYGCCDGESNALGARFWAVGGVDEWCVAEGEYVGSVDGEEGGEHGEGGRIMSRGRVYICLERRACQFEV